MPFDITLSPSVSEISITPGNKFILAFNMTNNTNSELILNSSVDTWLPRGNTGQIVYTNVYADPNISFSLNNADLSLGQEFTLGPAQKKQLVLKINAPTSVSRRDHYYTFFISQVGSEQSLAKIGAHIIISTQDKQEVDLNIEKFSISPFIKDTFFKPITFDALIKNNGKQHTKTIGKLTISKNDTKIKEFIVSPDTVLAGYNRSLRCVNDKAEIIPCALTPPFWPGIYKVNLELNSQKAVSFETAFFVFPFSIVITLGILFGFFLLLLKKKVKK